MTNDGWGSFPVEPKKEEPKPALASDGWGSTPTSTQALPPPDTWGETPEHNGWPVPAPKAEELPHVWGKPPEVGQRGDTWPCDKGSGSRYYVGYQNTMNYALLCGPYDTIEEAQERYPIAWERFQADKTLSWIFLNPSVDNLTVLALSFEKAMRKGAYGRL